MLMTQSSAGGEGGAINKDAIVNTSVNDIMTKLQKPYEEDKTLDEIDTNCGCDPKDPKVYFTNVVIKQEIQYVNKLIKKNTQPPKRYLRCHQGIHQYVLRSRSHLRNDIQWFHSRIVESTRTIHKQETRIVDFTTDQAHRTVQQLD